MNKTWQVLRWDPEIKAMRQIFVSREYRLPHFDSTFPSFIDLIRFIDVDGDGRTELVVGRGDGLFEFFNKETKELIGSFQLPSDVFADAAMVDVDQDGREELLILTSTSTLIVDGLESFPRGLLSVSRLEGAGSTRFFIGQLDDDSPLEILYDGGLVLEVGSWKTEWHVGEYSMEVMNRGLIDRDGNGVSEILVTMGDRVLTLDLKTKAELWHTTVTNELREFRLRLAQVDSDPALEMVIGANDLNIPRSEIFVVDSQTGAIESRLTAPRAGSGYPVLLAVADVDGDGLAEAIYAEGDRHNEEEMAIIRLSDGSLMWRSDNAQHIRNRVMTGDLDGDGHPELVVGGSNMVVAVDPETAKSIGRIEDLRGFELMEVKDVDGDGRCEVLLGSNWGGRERELKIFAYKDGHFSPIWSKAIEDPIHTGGNRIRAVAVADWDGDGSMEIIVGWSVDVLGHSETKASGVEIYRFADQKVVWNSPRQFGELSSMAVGNFDLDSGLEIAAAFGGKWLRVWDPAAAKEEFKLRGNFTALAALPGGFAAGQKSGHISRFFASKRGRLARKSVQRPTSSEVIGITPEGDGGTLWITNEKQYLRVAAQRWESFGIRRDPSDTSRNVALYHGATGSWLFATFSTLVRGFPLGK
ncbi:MAG TPA: VCBS repeat-containing protein [Chthoniobacteraceae bacterium]